MNEDELKEAFKLSLRLCQSLLVEVAQVRAFKNVETSEKKLLEFNELYLDLVQLRDTI
jgi:hypothetical protein